MEESKTLLPRDIHAMCNNLQTFWSDLTRRQIPRRSPSPSSCLPGHNKPFWSKYFPEKKKESKSLLSPEIRRRMFGIPVYKISDYDQCTLVLNSGESIEDDRVNNRELGVYCVSKADAVDLLELTDGAQVFDTPLTHIITFEGHMHPIRLVPESSQVKNAIQMKNEGRKNDSVDLSFSGVPVFLSDCFKMKIEETGRTFVPAFFRKEDLEKHIVRAVEPEKRDKIKVSSFEDIIQKMKDDSTSESNDIFFVGPGITSWTWFFKKTYRSNLIMLQSYVLLVLDFL